MQWKRGMGRCEGACVGDGRATAWHGDISGRVSCASDGPARRRALALTRRRPQKISAFNAAVGARAVRTARATGAATGGCAAYL